MEKKTNEELLREADAILAAAEAAENAENPEKEAVEEAVPEKPKKGGRKKAAKKKEVEAEEESEEKDPFAKADEEIAEQHKRKSLEGFEKRHDVRDLIARGKAKGKLTSNEIFEIIDESDCDVEQMEKIYETLESNGIEVTGYLDEDPTKLTSIESLGAYETDDDDESLTAEGIIVDDPVRMYLKEIGKVELLDTDREIELAEKMALGDEEAKNILVESNL
ncbi:MAG: hypothetical protein IKU43_11690, partial [Clostridia bacterium]|nr:hypothetical protein [Clostridia bacterium]